MIKSTRVRWAGNIARIGKKRNAYKNLVVNPEENRRLGILERTWVDNIKMDL
jgi:hypothetical protein